MGRQMKKKKIRYNLKIQKIISVKSKIKFLYVEQIFGGGIQENSLFPMAREPDRLQSRLLVLCHMENHAKFQVHPHCKNCFL